MNLNFWEFLTTLQWTYFATVCAILVPWYLGVLGTARNRRLDIRGEFFTAAFLLLAAEVVLWICISTAYAIHPAIGIEWTGPVHTFIVAPIAFIVLGVAAASSEHRMFRIWAGGAFAVHLAYVIGMLVWFSTTGELRFVRPEAFWLLLAIPVFVLLWRRSVALLTGVRKGAALVFRLLLLAVLIVAMSEPQVVQEQDDMAVIFVVDRSESMPGALLPEWYSYYIREKLALEGGGFEKDKVRYAIITFAGDPAVVQMLTQEQVMRLREPDDLANDVTDLAAAIRQALAIFPENARKRIVVISDGNSNRGDVLADLKLAQHYGVTIDVLPIETRRPRDIRIERLEVPGEVRLDQRFEPRLVIYATHECEVRLSVLVNGVPETMPEEAGKIVAELELERRQLRDNAVSGPDEAAARDKRLAEIETALEAIRSQYPPPTVRLKPGRNYPVLPGRRYSAPGFYEFSVEVHPQDADDDMPQNNAGSAFTVVRGSNRILFVHGDPMKPNTDFVRELQAIFTARARAGGGAVAVDVRDALNMPRSLAEWRIFDCVVLSNVPASAWKDDQQRALVAAVNLFGVGLVMLGGDKSYGAGGYRDQPIIEALPVKMEVEQQEFIPAGALMIVLHTCEFSDWNRRTKQMCRAALDALSDRDEFGIVIFDFNGSYIPFIPLQKIGDSANRAKLQNMCDQASPGDMPSFLPAFNVAYKALQNSTASTKHCIVISDGDPSQPGFDVIKLNFDKFGITSSGIVVAPHSDSDKATMISVAKNGGDPATWATRYYDVTAQNLNALPQIFTKEAVRVRTNLVQNGDFAVLETGQADFLESFAAAYPIVKGFVGVTPKARTQTPLRLQPVADPSAQPQPLLTYWQHGLGRVVCFMSDVKSPGWHVDWVEWANFRRFWGNVITWTARKSRADEETAMMRTELVDGRGHIVVDAVNAKGEPILLNDLTATVADPALNRETVELEMVEPGRYEAWFDAPRQGSYQVHGSYTQGGEPFVLTGGVSVPYSREYRDMTTNTALLASVATRTGGKMARADLVPAGGLGGVDIESPEMILGNDFLIDPDTDEFILNPATNGRVIYDPFAQDLPTAKSFTPIWQPFVIAALFLLLLDVFFRKVFVSWTQVTDNLAPVMARIPIAKRFFEVPQEIPIEEMQRLRAVKARIAVKHTSDRRERAKDVEKALAELQGGALPRPSQVKVEDEKAERSRYAEQVQKGHAEPIADKGFLKNLKEKAKDAARRPSAEPPKPDSSAKPAAKPAPPIAPKSGGLYDRLRDAKRGALDDEKKKD